MDILQEIKKEHEEFRDMVSQIENAEGKEKEKIFKELYAKVKGHHEAEEIVLFKDVKSKSDEEGKDIVLEMIEEHSLLEYQFSVIQKTSIENETWDAKFKVLKEVLEHHLDEEEEDLFKQAREVLTKEELEEKYEPFEETMEEYEEKQKDKLK